MTDNEIIKALECCSTYGKSCKECPAFVKVDRSKCREVLTGAIDLINRQRAEIERLQAYYDDMQSAIYSFREDHAKVKFFKGEIRAEAIKEFAERLKKNSCYTAIYVDCKEKESSRIYEINAEDLDYLVKEMVGADNA